MKIGNVSGTVLKRSILKQLHTVRDESMFEPTSEEMCAGIRVKESAPVIFSGTSVYGSAKSIGIFAMARAVNDIAARGADPIGVDVQIQLPPYAYESRLKAMVEWMEQAAERQNLQILCAKAEVSPAICEAIVHVNAVGTAEEEIPQKMVAEAGQDIVLAGWIGLEGMLRVAGRKEEELAKRFVPAFLNRIKGMEQELFALEQIWTAREHGASAIYQIGPGGILATLWEAAEAADVGLEADMKKMSIQQETVEICEYFRLNPYQMTSEGSLLIFTQNGEALVQKLQEAGKQAAVIGHTTNRKERVLSGGSERRFLDRPQPDELARIYESFIEQDRKEGKV